MRVLLDSHVLVWALTAPGRLSPRARGILEDPSVELSVSSASVWELFIKFHQGKMPAAEELFSHFDRHLITLGASELGILHAHAKAAAALRSAHRDPFDRMLAAQSIVEGLPVVTRDPQLKALGAKTLW